MTSKMSFSGVGAATADANFQNYVYLCISD